MLTARIRKTVISNERLREIALVVPDIYPGDLVRAICSLTQHTESSVP